MASPDEFAGNPNPDVKNDYPNGPDGRGALREFPYITADLPSADEAGEHVRGTLRDLGDATRRNIGQGRTAVVQNLESIADTVHEGAHRLPSLRLENLGDAAAGRLDAAAEYLRRNDIGRFVSRAEHLLKENPVPALLVAGVLGFLAGRAIAGASRG